MGGDGGAPIIPVIMCETVSSIDNKQVDNIPQQMESRDL